MICWTALLKIFVAPVCETNVLCCLGWLKVCLVWRHVGLLFCFLWQEEPSRATARDYVDHSWLLQSAIFNI